MQTYLPKELLNDGWVLHKEWTQGQWQWIVWHAHTGLKTSCFNSFHDSIEQAKHLAAFYELLPPNLLEFHWIHNRGWFQKLPTLIHWHQHDPKTATRWTTEYQQRASRDQTDHRLPVTDH